MVSSSVRRPAARPLTLYTSGPGPDRHPQPKKFSRCGWMDDSPAFRAWCCPARYARGKTIEPPKPPPIGRRSQDDRRPNDSQEVCAMLERQHTDDRTRTQVTFILPVGHPAGEASVVGDFNNWAPGAHRLVLRKDGSRAVEITFPVDERISFRYLAHGDYWFDEDGADGHDGRNSILHT
jgi:hypothetical protein